MTAVQTQIFKRGFQYNLADFVNGFKTSYILVSTTPFRLGFILSTLTYFLCDAIYFHRKRYLRKLTHCVRFVF